MPFKVKKGNTEVEVLGTHFNVNAYDDDEEIKITLLEGSVKILNDVSTITIKPGEQAVATSHSPITIHHSPDLEKVMAWKNGIFSFDKADMETIMRQMARWYDVEVIYNDKIKDHYTVDILRNVHVSQLFRFI